MDLDPSRPSQPTAPVPRRLRERRELLSGHGARLPRRKLLRARGRTQQPSRVFRTIAGWLLIVLGIVGLVLPILQGFLLLSAGVAVLGRRSLFVRWCRVRIRLLERRHLASPGIRGRLARWSKSTRLSWEHRRREKKLARGRETGGPGTGFAAPPRE